MMSFTGTIYIESDSVSTRTWEPRIAHPTGTTLLLEFSS